MLGENQEYERIRPLDVSAFFLFPRRLIMREDSKAGCACPPGAAGPRASQKKFQSRRGSRLWSGRVSTGSQKKELT